jgi:uncharacterized RDD family membrane protein YckC
MQQKPTAVPWHRLLAFFVDALIVCAVIAVLWLLLTDKIPKDQVAPDSGGFDIGDKRYAFSEESSSNRTLWLIGSIAAAFVVGVVLPAVNGSSPGRAVAGIRVVDREGRPPGFGKALVRWLLWVIDSFFFWLVGGIMVLVTEKNQRLGDMAAGTYTVRKELAGQPLPLEQPSFVGGGTYGPGGYAQQWPGAGGHPDPHGQARLRWWDGSQWTDHTSP